MKLEAGTNPGRRGGKQANSRLNYGMALITTIYRFVTMVYEY
jgi:hypothetical protein